jgi:cob(I)alamin adenosyltransferase
MVVLNRIYTRTGDDGTTALGTGERRKKYDLRIAAYGTVDELNAAIGLARLHAAQAPAIDALLARVQNDLFDLGADLCSPDKGKGPQGARLTVTDLQVGRLEQEIDAFNANLAPLRSFILPGGTPGAAYLHLARTVCRRAEPAARSTTMARRMFYGCRVRTGEQNISACARAAPPHVDTVTARPLRCRGLVPAPGGYRARSAKVDTGFAFDHALT